MIIPFIWENKIDGNQTTNQKLYQVGDMNLIQHHHIIPEKMSLGLIYRLGQLVFDRCNVQQQTRRSLEVAGHGLGACDTTLW